jgi:hypothetical protein
MATVESIKRQCETLFRDHFETYLNTVFDNWHETESFPLPTIRQYIYGGLSGTRTPNQFPALSVLHGRVREVEKWQSNVSEWEAGMALRVHLTNANDEALAKLIDRYFEAVMLLLQAYPRLGGELHKAAHTFEITTTTTEPWENTAFVKGLQIAFWAPFIGPS